jgi:hypothetical protein
MSWRHELEHFLGTDAVVRHRGARSAHIVALQAAVEALTGVRPDRLDVRDVAGLLLRCGWPPSELDRPALFQVVRFLEEAAAAKGLPEVAAALCPPPERPQEPTRRERRRRWTAEAMILIGEHPDWSDRQIAEVVNVDPSRLSRCEAFRRARQLARQRLAVPKGRCDLDPETGLRTVDGED